MFDQLPGIERHQQAFAGALGVPDHACASVALALGFHTRQTVVGRVFGHTSHGTRSTNCRCHRLPYRVELVVARDDLSQPRTGFAEDREVTEQIEQAAMLEHAFNQCREFRRTFRSNARAVGGAPRHEALKVCRQ